MATTTPTAHEVLTRGCGLLDRSERGKLALTGPEAAGLLTGQVSNDVEALAAGSGCYATLLTNKGKMLGDLRVLAVGGDDPELHLDCERPALQALFDQLRRAAIGWQAELHKRTLQEGLVSLIGPASRDVVRAAAQLEAARTGTPPPPEVPTAEHDHVVLAVEGVPVRAVATDLGIDLLCAADDTATLTTAMLDGGAHAVTEQDAEVVRVASGRPRYGIDLDDGVIPQEAGLNERAVSFTKGCYVGQETVARLHWRGKPNRHLRGLRLDGPVPEHAPLSAADGKAVGAATSVVAHPELGWIALALVRREVEPGATVAAGDGATATVVALPFS